MNFKLFNTIFIVLILSFTVNAQKKNEEKPEVIKWYSFEDAINLNAKHFPKKKVLIDVYTDWCGWCKKMDATTFSHPEIVKYINENFYAVKLNAERKDSIILDGKLYINPNPTVNRSTHQLAEVLLNYRLSYPSYVFMDEMNRPITIVPGYSEAVNFEPILHYFGENQYLKLAWETYQKQFVGKVGK